MYKIIFGANHFVNIMRKNYTKVLLKTSVLSLQILLTVIFSLSNFLTLDSINTYPYIIKNTHYKMHFDWPCKPKCKILKDYDDNLPKYSAGNRGLDLEVAEGEKIYAPFDGVVFYRGKIDGKNILSIKHINDIRTTYVGLESSLKIGTTIAKGKVIGVTNYDNMKEKSLQFGVISGKDEYLNPKNFLYEKIVLLPIYNWNYIL